MASKKSRSRRSGSTAGSLVPPPAVGAAPPTIVPPSRRLKVFSLDPSADVQLENSLISRSVLQVPWESPLIPGPIGEYVEVIDVDPSSRCVYDPVDLDDPGLLAQDGLSPSTGNPQFHQQMVYAVAMKTITNFEQVLGRRLLWAERRADEKNRYLQDPEKRYVQRLRIYPHALREQNAYYSPSKRSLLFGYFNAPTTDSRDELPGGLVFTCLSHDIVAHETTHAILDGMHRRMLDPTNPDMVAFHEAFADIVAIFQHFTLPGLLLDQIQKTRGDIRTNSLLAQLASQFARATGQGDALRNALGTTDESGNFKRPDPSDLSRTFEPHERGAILVAAVFDAFVRMYESRVADLRRIATGGTGVLPKGDIHPDLARRFAEEAVRLSQRVLNMCIRAIDYLPPVDVTFGDYLRALVTADADFFPDDPKRYRLAFIEAFRDRGIYPLDVRALAEDALRWKPLTSGDETKDLLPPSTVLRTMAAAYDSKNGTQDLGATDENDDLVQGDIFNDLASKNFNGAARRFLDAAWPAVPSKSDEITQALGDRFPRYLIERMFARFLHGWIEHKARALQNISPDRKRRVGLNLGIDLESLVRRDLKKLRLEVHAVRPTVRLRPDGRSKVELLIVLGQKTYQPLLAETGKKSVMTAPDGSQLWFTFRGGSTLIIDPDAAEPVTYAVSKNILSEARLARSMAFLRERLAEDDSAITRFGLIAVPPEIVRQGQNAIDNFIWHRDSSAPRAPIEPFAIAHAPSTDGASY